MKKALALVLALVLALSMAVSAFAAGLVTLVPVDPEEEGKTKITVVDAYDEYEVLYASKAGTYYIALDPTIAYTDVKLTTKGILDAELVKWDPETMELTAESNMVITYTVYDVNGNVAASSRPYEEAKVALAELENLDEVTTYYMTCDQFVNIIKVTVEENYTAHYLEGELKIDAKVGKEAHSGTLHFINDVSIFEYEEVKHASKYFADEWALWVDVDGGYSDYHTYIDGGYGETYIPDDLRTLEQAAVVSTTAFRAIAGQDLCLVANQNDKVQVLVYLYDIVEGQKGVNFKNYYKEVYEEVTGRKAPLERIEVGFLGDQVIKGEYEIEVNFDLDRYDIRELFTKKVEEDDIITYYVVDENNNVVDKLTVDYMKDDLTVPVSFTIEGKNSKLGSYAIVIDVPANEVAGESNPNTGAESVVGVVAALAVVSVATAAAVSLKK